MTIVAVWAADGSFARSTGVAHGRGSARHGAAEDAAQQDAGVAAEKLVADIAAKAQPDDQHDHQPRFAWVEHVERDAKLKQAERVVGLIRQHRQNDARDQHELHDRPQVLVAEFRRDTVQFGLELQKHGHAAADGNGHLDRANHHECSHGVHQQHGHVGGGARVRIGARAEEMGNYRHGRDGDQAGGHDPTLLVVVGQDNRQAAQHGNQRKSAHAGHPTGRMLPLQTDQQSQQDGDSQLLKHWLHQANYSTKGGTPCWRPLNEER